MGFNGTEPRTISKCGYYKKVKIGSRVSQLPILHRNNGDSHQFHCQK
jgi:hypothetical protein